MKGLLIGGGVLLGLILGFVPGGITRRKPLWWRALAVASMLVLFVLALGVPVGGDFMSAAAQGRSRVGADLPVRGVVKSVSSGQAELTDLMGTTQKVALAANAGLQGALPVNADVILSVQWDTTAKSFTATRLLSTSPWFSLPLIPGLEERARNLYLHVPTAWLAQLAWFIACFYAIQYLRKRRPEDDIRAEAAAGAGALFCILATVTGAVWARFNWGVFWNWDPRQTSIFIVLIVYGAYFSLRSGLQNGDNRSKVSAVYLIVLLLPVLYFLFVFPRMQEGLHPGAGSLESGSVTDIGPVLSAQRDALALIKQVLFGLSMFAFTMIFFWLVNLSVRSRLAVAGYDQYKSTVESGNAGITGAPRAGTDNP